MVKLLLVFQVKYIYLQLFLECIWCFLRIHTRNDSRLPKKNYNNINITNTSNRSWLRKFAVLLLHFSKEIGRQHRQHQLNKYVYTVSMYVSKCGLHSHHHTNINSFDRFHQHQQTVFLSCRLHSGTYAHTEH